jgi:hypothetical protein
MSKDEAIITLKSLLDDLEAAYYGGFRPVTDEKDHEAIRYAIELLESKL